MFFLIGGIRPRTRTTGDTRVGPCLRCQRGRLFRRVEMRQYLELFFLPVLPLGGSESAWRCEECGALRADAGSQGGRPSDDAGIGARPEATAPDAGTRARPESPSRADSGVPARFRYCHFGGQEIENAPKEGRLAGARRFQCDRCGREFEVMG